METKDPAKKGREGTILEEMVISKSETVRDQKGGLIAETRNSSKQSEDFANQIRSTLEETERALLDHSERSGVDASRIKGWQTARQLTSEFRPVPWFIWRICNFALGTGGEINAISDGMVFGLRRLMYAAASDPYLGSGEKINDVRRALRVVPSDVVAAVSVIHAICRRLAASQYERIWRPILDDALLRARIGWMAGQLCEDFGAGRCMLAGFTGRSSMAIMIASGELEQARSSLELLATGTPVQQVGLELYGCEPLQVSSMVLSAIGCGRDAAYGAARFASAEDPVVSSESTLEQRRWVAAFSLCEHIRTGQLEHILEEHWNVLGFDQKELRDEIEKQGKLAARRGHEWNWIV